jgi:phenylpropionate dioxygenase-like ring-hydroxylating dioxygenase large terminal subunit
VYIPPEAYYSTEYYEKEFFNIFSKKFFVTFKNNLSVYDDYYSYKLYGKLLTTRNTDVGLSTYDNVCLHRSNLIDELGFGRKPFRCNYHGWQYGTEGQLSRHPLVDSSCINIKKVNNYLAVDVDGLIFSSLENSDIRSVGKNTLKDIGYTRTDVFHQESLLHMANWKLLVENVVEGYHLSFVHPNSFVPMGISSTSAIDINFDGADSWTRVHAKNKEKQGEIMPGSPRDYLHAYIFPNLFISITGGLIGFISHFKPNSADSTVLDWALFETELLKQEKLPVRDYIKNQAIKFTNKVLREDLTILNNCQMSIKQAYGCHQLQENEPRLRHFHKNYLEMMG